MKRLLATAVVVFSAWQGAASAASLRLEISGTLNSVDIPLSDFYSPGDKFTLAIIVDQNDTDTRPTFEDVGLYERSLLSGSLGIGTYALEAEQYGTTNIANDRSAANPPDDLITFKFTLAPTSNTVPSASISGGPVIGGGLFPYAIGAIFSDTSQTALSSTDLELFGVDFDQFDATEFYLGYATRLISGAAVEASFANGTIDSVTVAPVPVTASSVTFLSAFLGLFLASRRRRRPNL